MKIPSPWPFLQIVALSAAAVLFLVVGLVLAIALMLGLLIVDVAKLLRRLFA